jgi:hypothetical protein
MTQFFGSVGEGPATATTTATANGNGNGNGKSEMRGFLYCATHDETVRSFGRNDTVFGWVREGNGNGNRNGNSHRNDNDNPPFSMKLKKDGPPRFIRWEGYWLARAALRAGSNSSLGSQFIVVEAAMACQPRSMPKRTSLALPEKFQSG